MRLLLLEVAGFRGVEHLRLSLDDTTVLLGENRVGKTTLVDAIEHALGPRPATECPFRVSDLRRGPGSPPPIELTLTWGESAPGDFQTQALDFLQPVVHANGAEEPRVTLRLSGTLDPDGEQVQSAWAFLDAEGNPLTQHSDLSRVERLRRLSPCLLLAANRYYQDGQRWDGAPSAGDAPEGDARQVVERVYRRACLTRGNLSLAEVKAGLDAARELRVGGYERRAPREERRDLEDLIETPRDLAPLPLHEAESSLSAQNLAMLILVGGLLEAQGQTALPPEACPVVVIEEPEAHLHPILAASLWGTLEQLQAQKVITTNSGDLLASAPLNSVRRLRRPGEETTVHQLTRRALSWDDRRRVAYHVRIQRGASLFARCWLLVEGETESWLLPELARACGYVLASEGITCLEFAQCGVRPLVKLANALGIEWHLIADGDEAGANYVRLARTALQGHSASERITRLDEHDVEGCLYHHGYARVFEETAFPGRRASVKHHERRRRGKHRRRRGPANARDVIQRAIKRRSKPYLALRVLEAMAEPGSAGVPQQLRRAVEAAVWLARASAGVPAPRPKTLRLRRQ